MDKYKNYYKKLIDQTHTVFLTTDDAGIIEDANMSGARLFGFESFQDLTGRSIFSLVAPESRQEAQAAFKQFLIEGSLQDFEVAIVSTDGDKKHCIINAIVCDTPDGIRALSFFRDTTQLHNTRQALERARYNLEQRVRERTTELKQTNDALRVSEERFLSIVETTSNWIWETDTEGVFTYVGPKIKDLLGYEPKEVIGRSYSHQVLPEEAARIEGVFSRALERQEPVVCLEIQKRHKNGIPIWVEASGVPILDFEGQVCGYRGADRDITERKRYEKALLESEQKTSKIFRLNPVGIAITILESGKVIDVNESFSRISGYSREELLGRTPFHLGVYTSRGERDELLDELKQYKTIRNLEFSFTTKAGDIRTGSFSFESTRIADVPCIITTINDVTNYKQIAQALQESEEQYRILVETSPDMVSIFQDNKLHYANKSFCETLGWTYEEVTSDSFNLLEKLFSPELRSFISENVNKRLAGEEIPVYETFYSRKDGSKFPVLVRNKMIPYRGRPALLSYCIDISEQKRIRQELTEREEQYRNIFNTAPDGIGIVTREGIILDLNPALMNMLGYSQKELQGMLIERLIHSDQRQDLDNIKGALDVQGEVKMESCLVTKNGTALPVEIHGRMTTFKGRPAMLTIINNISESKQSEKELRKKAEEMDALHRLSRRLSTRFSAKNVIREAVEGIERARQADQVLFWLRQGNELVLQNAEPEEAFFKKGPPVAGVGKCLCGLAAGRGKPVYSDKIHKNRRCNLEECQRTGFKSFVALPVGNGDYNVGVICLASLEKRNFKQEAAFLETLAGEIFIGIRNAQLFEKVKQQEERFRTIADFTANWEYWEDPAGCFVYCSPSSERVTGHPPEAFEEDPGLFNRIISPDDREKWSRHSHSPEIDHSDQGLEFRIIHKSGKIRWVAHTCNRVYSNQGDFMGIRASNQDITQEKKIQEHLIRADRLASLGQLSAGIAHEIRNPLAGMRLFLDILYDEEKFEHAREVRDVLNELKNGVNKIDGIIRRVINFSKDWVGSSSEVEINTLIKDTLSLWKQKFRTSKIKQTFSLDKKISRIKGDYVSLQQVINNLVSNAVEEMEQGGFLNIATSGGISSLNGKHEVVIIRVKDTGNGIEPEYQKNVFDQFFTTKPGGTGLGLGITHQIVTQHGGVVFLESEPGEGTTFTVELPCVGASN